MLTTTFTLSLAATVAVLALRVLAAVVAPSRALVKAPVGAGLFDEHTRAVTDEVAVMDRLELESRILWLAAQEQQLRTAGDVAGARTLGVQRFACIAELRSRGL